MVQLHGARFSPNTIHSNEVSCPLLSRKHHLTVRPVIPAVIVAGHFINGIPTRPSANLVDCQDCVEVTVIGVDLGRATLVRCEGCPCGGTTRCTGVIRLTRILRRPRGVVNRGSGEREFSRHLLKLPQLGNQTR